jgi:hypothetical protein
VGVSVEAKPSCSSGGMDGGPRQQSACLRYHTIVRGQTDQLACSARKRKRQRLRGREYPARHLRESLVCLRIVRRLTCYSDWRAVAHTSSALATAYTIIQS